jgi:hypothetical protein
MVAADGAAVQVVTTDLAPGSADVSLSVEVLDGAGVSRRFVSGAESSYEGLGLQVLSAEGVGLTVKGERQQRIRITVGAQVAQGGAAGATLTVRLAPAPYIRRLGAEITDLYTSKLDRLATVTVRPGASTLPTTLASGGDVLISSSGTVTLPAGLPDRTVLHVWHDAASGTVTLAAGAGTTLRAAPGAADMEDRGEVRRCVLRSNVWYVA